MDEPNPDALMNASFVPWADFPPSPLVSIGATQLNLAQIHAETLTDEFNLGWSMPPAEGQAAEVLAQGTFNGNVSQNAPQLTAATSPPVLPNAHASTCELAGGSHCDLPLYHSMRSIRVHLRMHGHRHPQRQVVQCPWTGCSESLQWANMPRHIQSIHLGIRFNCPVCGRPFTRRSGVARHTAPLKCNGQHPFSAEKNMLIAEDSLDAAWSRGRK